MFAIDATESMQPLIDKVKSLTLSFREELEKGLKENRRIIKNLRIKVIVFRDYYVDDKYAMEESRFFILPEEKQEFYNFVSKIKAGGGGDEPESGLEALALALRSDFVKDGDKKRHVIVLFTDASAHPLEQQEDGVPSNYPSNMFKNLGDLYEAWGKGQDSLGSTRNLGVQMAKDAKRLVLFAPSIYKESKEDKARVMLTVAMSLADLHKKGIVHGDLDPRNILISRVAGSKNLVTKLIDFSDSFFENDPPETIMSKDFWWSPEVAFYSKAAASGVSPNPYKKYISCKADVFSLGIVFHQYCAKGGKPPICTKAQPWQEFNTGKTPQIASEIEPEFRALISDMLECEPSKRPAMAEVHKRLLQILKPEMGKKNVEEEQKKREAEEHQRQLEIERQKTEEEERRRKVSEEYQQKLDEEQEKVGSSGLTVGNGVKRARIHEKNPRKVVLTFENGREQIMDLNLAAKLGYVKN